MYWNFDLERDECNTESHSIPMTQFDYDHSAMTKPKMMRELISRYDLLLKTLKTPSIKKEIMVHPAVLLVALTAVWKNRSAMSNLIPKRTKRGVFFCCSLLADALLTGNVSDPARSICDNPGCKIRTRTHIVDRGCLNPHICTVTARQFREDDLEKGEGHWYSNLSPGSENFPD